MQISAAEEGAFAVGASFPTLPLARLALDVYLLRRGKTKVRVRGGPGCCGFACYGGCGFFAGFNERVGGRWELTKLIGVEHDNCAGHGPVGAKLVAAVAGDLDIKQKGCTYKAVIEEMKRRFGVNITRGVASECLTFRRQQEEVTFEENFKLIDSFVEQYLIMDPAGRAEVEVHEDNVFRGAFFMPSGCVAVASNCKPVLALDACHLKNKWRQGRLLFAVTQDGDKSNVVAAFAVVDSENHDSYVWFLRRMKEDARMAGYLAQPDMVILSDRSKGLLSAVAQELPGAAHMFCTRHLIESIRSYLRRNEHPTLIDEAANHIWAAQCASDQTGFNIAITALRQANEPAYQHLQTIPAAAWAQHAFPKPAYGLRTTNLMERTNAWALGHREATTITDLISSILAGIGTAFEARRKVLEVTPGAAQAPRTYCSAAALVLEKQQQLSANYQLIVNSDNPDGEMVVAVSHLLNPHTDTRRVTVCDTNYTCSCGIPFHHKMPCRHVLAVISGRDVQERFANIRMDDIYLAAPLRDAYSTAVVGYPEPRNLTVSERLRAPPLDPKKNGKRCRPADEKAHGDKQQRRTCSGCGDPGHTIRTCPARQQLNEFSGARAADEHVGPSSIIEDVNPLLFNLHPEQLNTLLHNQMLRAIGRQL